MHRRVPAAGKARAHLSFARRAFLVSLMGICAAISVSFLALNLAIRTEIKAGIKDSLRRTERSIEQARAAQSSRMALALQLVSEDPALTDARLALCEATRIVLRNGLDMLGISQPTSM